MVGKQRRGREVGRTTSIGREANEDAGAERARGREKVKVFLVGPICISREENGME